MALGTVHLSAKDSMKGTMREGYFTRDSERYVRQSSEISACFRRGLAFGEHGGALFLGAFLLEVFL